VPLRRVVGDEIGGVFRRLHADHGVELRLPGGVAELRAASAGGGAVEQVVLRDGTVEDADVVVVGIGVTPRVDLAVAAGLQVDGGILVDPHLESSAAGVYAAGDVAAAWNPRYDRHLRVEHWSNALHQGLVAGTNAGGGHETHTRAGGGHETHTRLPYFFSDQYDLGLEYVGQADPGDTVVVRGRLADGAFVAFWQRDGVVTAAMHVNVWDAIGDLRAIVTAGRALDPARLADPAVPLAELA
jgi:3-phenylpropionate/trans-cinnamate dioxygenase ferredoxin reductase subunit